MEYAEFVRLVVRMRNAQCRYFGTKRGDAKDRWLQYAMALEKQVDIEIEKIQKAEQLELLRGE